jgi:hypothetical protein
MQPSEWAITIGGAGERRIASSIAASQSRRHGWCQSGTSRRVTSGSALSQWVCQCVAPEPAQPGTIRCGCRPG